MEKSNKQKDQKNKVEKADRKGKPERVQEGHDFIRNPEEKSTESQGGVSDSLKGGKRY